MTGTKSNGSSPIIAPSLLAANFGELKAEIQAVEDAGANWLHLDVMDGSFVPPITFGANMVALAKSCSKLPADVHLMIEHPEQHLDAFLDAGADVLTFHLEATPHPHRLLQAIRARNVQAGVAINPGTPFEQIEPLIGDADLILAMTVNPGWGGQSFIESTLAKIERVANEVARQSLQTHIEVDGGINPETGKRACDAGANVLVAGTSVFKSSDYKQAIEALRS